MARTATRDTTGEIAREKISGTVNARAKICGLRTRADLDACIDGGAAYVGFVDFPKSPRHITVDQAQPLLDHARGRVSRVLLCVNPDAAQLAPWIAAGVDIVQLHGRETPQQVAAIRAMGDFQVMKAVGVAARADVAQAIETYGDVVDLMLFDAKPPVASDLPGGNAHAFDWSIVRDQPIPVPWMLAGGLHAGNAAQAIATSGASILDVSSGVEAERGVKNATKIAEFLSAVEAAA